MKEIITPALIFAFIVLATNISCVSTTDIAKAYFVSHAGNDNDPGTKNKPFKSLQKLNTLGLDPGTRIYLKRGEDFSGTLALTLNGLPENPIVINSYENQNGNAVIDGGDKEAVILQGHYFELKNINVKGSGRKNGNVTNGISLRESSYGLIENIRAEGFQKSGLEIESCNIGKQVDPLLNGPFVTSVTDPYKLTSLTGYMLQPGSPLKNKGINLPALFKISFPSNDFFGNPVPLGNNPEPGVGEIKE